VKLPRTTRGHLLGLVPASVAASVRPPRASRGHPGVSQCSTWATVRSASALLTRPPARRIHRISALSRRASKQCHSRATPVTQGHARHSTAPIACQPGVARLTLLAVPAPRTHVDLEEIRSSSETGEAHSEAAFRRTSVTANKVSRATAGPRRPQQGQARRHSRATPVTRRATPVESGPSLGGRVSSATRRATPVTSRATPVTKGRPWGGNVTGVRVSRAGCAGRQVAVLNMGDGSQRIRTADSPASPALHRISVVSRRASKQCHTQGHARHTQGHARRHTQGHARHSTTPWDFIKLYKLVKVEHASFSN